MSKMIFCWTCHTDLRGKNRDLHEHLGHSIEELDKDPRIPENRLVQPHIPVFGEKEKGKQSKEPDIY
jgi:hypothetical protein